MSTGATWLLLRVARTTTKEDRSTAVTRPTITPARRRRIVVVVVVVVVDVTDRVIHIGVSGWLSM
jgi:hypothetical protein